MSTTSIHVKEFYASGRSLEKEEKAWITRKERFFMNAYDLAGFLYFTPYLLILFLGISIEIVLLRRIRRKKAEDNSLRENGVQISGSLVTCRKRTRMADMTFTYEVRGKIYSQVQHVPEKTCNTVRDGDSVIVFYDEQTPERSLLKDIEREYGEVLPAIVLFLLLLVYGLMLVGFLIVILIMSFINLL